MLKIIMPIKTTIKTLIFSLLFLSHITYATDEEDNGDLALFIEYADGINIDNYDQYLVGIGVQYSEETNEFINHYTRIALTMPLSDDNNPQNDFSISQVEIGVGLKADYAVSPYIGAGLVVGEHERCTVDNHTFQEDCRDESHLGIYPEYGLGVSLGKRVLINIYARNYLMTEGVEDFVVVGINLVVYLND